MPELPALLGAFAVGASHFVIDLRTALKAWRDFIGQTTDPKNPITLHVAIWQDQAAHLIVLALAALVLSA